MNYLLKISIFVAILSSIAIIIFPNLLNNKLLFKKLCKLLSIDSKLFSTEVKPNSKTSCLSSGERLFTREELSRYDGSSDSLGLYLSFLGIVYDVSKGAQHYRPGGSYSFFAGKDATRAYITGEFTESGLNDDLTGIETESFDGLKTWVDLYENDYKRVGKLFGTYYDQNGCETKALKWVHKKIEENNKLKSLEKEESKVFPFCNSEWNANEKSGRVWCSRMSGGIDRDWVGVPRQLFMTDKKQYRCACVRNTGPPTAPAIVYADDDNQIDTNFDNSNNVGDLNNPRLKQYEGCDQNSFECKIKD